MENIKINNTTLTFNNVYYTDYLNGDDLEGNGSKVKPYKTFQKSYGECLEYDAVFLMEGEHILEEVDYGLGRETCMFLNKENVSVIGEASKTTITCSKTSNFPLYSGFLNMNATHCDVYNIIFAWDYNPYSIVCDGAGYVSRFGNIHNCVFKFTESSCLFYINTLEHITLKNCAFITPNVNIYQNRGYYKVLNGAFSASIPSSSHVVTETCLENCNFNEDYHITSNGWENAGTGTNPDGSQAHIGVYGGEFGWCLLITLSLIKSSSFYYTFDGVNLLTTSLSEPLTQADFEEYGMDSLDAIPDEKLLELWDGFEILTWTDAEDVPKIELTVPDYRPVDLLEQPFELHTWTDGGLDPVAEVGINETEVYWAIKINNKLYIKDYHWKEILESDIYLKGMTKAQVEAIEDFSEVFEQGEISLVGVMKTNDENETPWVSQVNIDLPQAFESGTSVVTTELNPLNTLDWTHVNSVEVIQTTPPGSEIKYAFSSDDKVTWRVYRDSQWKTILNIETEGMLVEELNSIDWYDMIWNTNTYRIHLKAWMKSESITESPSIDKITFDHDKIPQLLQTNNIGVILIASKPFIIYSTEQGRFIGTFNEEDNNNVSYRILLNGVQVYPETGQYTNPMPVPFNIDYKWPSTDIKLDEENVLTVEALNEFGEKAIETLEFIGQYNGFLFKNENGQYYTTDEGDIIKWLNFGAVYAGSITMPRKVIFENKSDSPTSDLSVFVENGKYDDLEFQISETLNPFIPVNKIEIDHIIDNGETMDIYVRVRTERTAKYAGNVNASIVVE